MNASHLGAAWREHLRLTLLRVLHEAPGNAGNDSLLTAAVRTIGIQATRDQVRTELTWLQDHGLVRLEELEHLLIAKLTTDGDEVAQGLRKVPGVARPTPRG
jgi:hypothetical protein